LRKSAWGIGQSAKKAGKPESWEAGKLGKSIFSFNLYPLAFSLTQLINQINQVNDPNDHNHLNDLNDHNDLNDLTHDAILLSVCALFCDLGSQLPPWMPGDGLQKPPAAHDRCAAHDAGQQLPGL